MYSGDTDFVFLGGSCNPTTWRSDIAIPLLTEQLVNYYNPQVSRWYPELIEKENFAKEFASVLFFFIDNQTRSISAMIEVAELSATPRKLVCVINEYNQHNTVICGESITNKELYELHHAQKIIKNLALRQGVPVFNCIYRAMNCVSELVKANYSTDQLIHDLRQNYYSKYLKFSDKIFRLKEIFRSLDVSKIGKIRLIDARYAVRAILGFEITDEELNSIKFCQLRSQFDFNENDENRYDMPLNFEQFLCLIAIYDYELEKHNSKHPNKQIGPGKQPVLSSKGVLSNNQSSNILKPTLQKFIDFFSSAVNHQPSSRQSNRQSLHLKNSENTNVVRRSNSINRISKMNSNTICQIPNNSKFIMNSGLHSNNSYHNLNSAGEDEVDFICNSVKNNVLNSRIKTKSPFPFQVECRDVYLGGTCSSKWRENVAIPLLRKQHLTYYYQYENFYQENINPFEASAILNSRVLFFVITNNSRSLSSMLMAAHYIAKGYRVVMCIQHIAEGEIINGEKISEIARKDYNRGRDYLMDMVKRYDQELFTDIAQATVYAGNLSKALRTSKAR